MTPSYPIHLEFDPALDKLGKGKSLRDGLSVAVQIGNSLWVANDETVSLERLSLVREGTKGDAFHGRDHQRFALADYLKLPAPADGDELEEADLEGLAYDNGYLWLVGSHSLKRKKPNTEDGIEKAQKHLAKVGREGNRYLLARIPVVEREGTYSLAATATHNGIECTAAQLHGDARGNDLSDVLRDDPHLGPFLTIPGKDNGFDIEGLAVADARMFLGLRGPVLRGWAMILEVEVADGARSSTFKLHSIGSDDRRYRKHFLQLGGLGLRDLCVQGDDLLILAGPTLDLDGPVRVLRWPGALKAKGEQMVPARELEQVMDIPYGAGVDHAEGMTLFAPEGGAAHALLVVYDATSAHRQSGKSTVAADVFPLP